MDENSQKPTIMKQDYEENDTNTKQLSVERRIWLYLKLVNFLG